MLAVQKLLNPCDYFNWRIRYQPCQLNRSLADARKAVSKTLVVLVGGMFEETITGREGNVRKSELCQFATSG
jgi:hypothetical protein